MRKAALTLSLLAASVVSPAAQTTSTPAPPPVYANMNQLMRGVLYPAANVVFFAQADNPADVKWVEGRDPAMATDPLASVFGGWQAVENAALALAESASLLSIPGRTCANGVPVPVKDPEWETFVQQVRDESMKSYAASKAKDQDKIIELSLALSNSCSNCHRRFRDRRGGAENRCRVEPVPARAK
jgi:hypothetical protein